MIALTVVGAAGRMGRRILTCALAEKDWKIVGAVDHEGSPHIGQDAGELIGEGIIHVPVNSELGAVIQNSDVIIDFSQPQASLHTLTLAKKFKKALVVGTTGFSDSQKEEFKKAGETIPILLAPNMSVGVNLLFELAAQVAGKLGDDYDIEIVEAHHRFKKDAPSGTAQRLIDVMVEARGLNRKKDVVHGHQGKTAERKGNEIAVHAVRAGDIVGDHTVTFCTAGERLELTHRAHSRDTFAKGSLRAARFLAKKKPGFYTMQEVLKR